MSGWPKVALGELCEVNIGRTPSRNDPTLWSGVHPWASIRDLADGEVWETREGISDKALERMPAPVQAGTLLASFKLTIGRVAVAQQAMHHNEAIASLPIKCPSRVDRDYLRHVLPKIMLATTANNAVLGKVLNKAAVKALSVPLPPLEEQRRIVGLLDRAAEIRRRANAARTQARAIIPALFTDMFGDPATNPKGWPSQPLGLVIDRIVGGKNLEAGNGSSYHRILKVSAVTSGYFRPEEAKPAPDEHQPIPDHRVRNGDFLFSRANTSALVGAVAIVDGEYKGLLLPDKIWRIEWQVDAVEPRFMYSLMRSSHIRRVFARLASGTSDSMKNISQAKLRSIEIPLPPLPLQTAFAEQARRIEATARTLDAAAAKAEALAAALSAEVFDMPAAASPATGRVAEPAPA